LGEAVSESDARSLLSWHAVFEPSPNSADIHKIRVGILTRSNFSHLEPQYKNITYIDKNFVDPQTVGGRGTAIWVFGLETSQKQTVWQNTLGFVGNPISISWSPDGRRIGFARVLVRQGLGQLTYDLFDLNSGLIQTVLDSTLEPRFCGGILPGLMDIHWTKESAKVVLSFPEGCWKLISSLFAVEPTLPNPGLWLFEEGREPKLLSDLSRYAGIDISPDGTFVVFTSESGLYKINVDGSGLTKIAESAFNPIIAP